jgi:hypothetical protein
MLPKRAGKYGALRWHVVTYTHKAFQGMDEALKAGRPRPLDADLVGRLCGH